MKLATCNDARLLVMLRTNAQTGSALSSTVSAGRRHLLQLLSAAAAQPSLFKHQGALVWAHLQLRGFDALVAEAQMEAVSVVTA